MNELEKVTLAAQGIRVADLMNESVAKKLGWGRVGEPNKPLQDLWSRDGKYAVRELPRYAFEIGPAWEIVEFVSKNIGILSIEMHGIGFPHYAVSIQEVPLPEIYIGRSSSAPLAICEAFLAYYERVSHD